MRVAGSPRAAVFLTWPRPVNNNFARCPKAHNASTPNRAQATLCSLLVNNSSSLLAACVWSVGMPLTREELESIQADCMADDLEIDLAKMSLWTLEQATSYFETGEEPAAEPEAAAAAEDDAEAAAKLGPDPELIEMLQGAGLEHLLETVKGQTVDAWVQLFREDRPKFLPMLKDVGVAKLPERQKLRDCIRDLATPPEGSKRQLREEYRDELAKLPWAVVPAAGFESAAQTSPPAKLSRQRHCACGGRWRKSRSS